MLYGIGMLLILLSSAFVGGSPLVPVVMVIVGGTLLFIGKEAENEQGNTEAEDSGLA